MSGSSSSRINPPVHVQVSKDSSNEVASEGHGVRDEAGGMMHTSHHPWVRHTTVAEGRVVDEAGRAPKRQRDRDRDRERERGEHACLVSEWETRPVCHTADD